MTEHLKKAGKWACSVLVATSLAMGLFLIPEVSQAEDPAYGAILPEALEDTLETPTQEPSENDGLPAVSPLAIQEENRRSALSDADTTDSGEMPDALQENNSRIADPLEHEAIQDTPAEPAEEPAQNGAASREQDGQEAEADTLAFAADAPDTDEESAVEADAARAAAYSTGAPVMNLSEFTAAVTDPSVNYITLGADITLTAYITIPSSKASLTIDGQGLFTLEQASLGATLYSTSTVGAHYTFKDLNIIGRNFYGLVSCMAVTSAPTITIHNVDYSGPQIVYNRYGNLVFSGSNSIVIQANGTTSNVAEEVAEVHSVSVSGSLKVHSTTTGFSFFWMFGAGGKRPSFTIEPGAEAVFETTKKTPFGFFFVNDLNIDFTVSDGAYLNMNLGGFIPLCSGSTHRLQSMTVGHNATALFEFAGGVALDGPLSVQEGAVLKMNYITKPESSSPAYLYPLFWFTSTTSGTTLMDIDRPKAMVFAVQPTDMAMFNLRASGKIEFKTTDLNAWDNYAAAAANSEPTSMWYAEETNGFTGSIVLRNGNDSLSSIESNNTEFAAGFKPNSSRVLQWGTDPMPLSASVSADAKTITGTTVPGASVYATYQGTDGQTHRYSTVSSAQGSFAIDIAENSLVAEEPVFVVAVDGFIAVHTHTAASGQQAPAADPVLQIIEKGTPFPSDGMSLLANIAPGSAGPVEATISQSPDTNIVGPATAQVALVNSAGLQVVVTVPVFITDEHVAISEDRSLALRAESFGFEKAAFPAEDLDGFILRESRAQAWQTMTGADISDQVSVVDTTLENASGTYDAMFAVQGLSRTILITVSDYNDWVNVRIPTSMLFGTLDLHEDGAISSPRYEIENKSMYDVKVGLGAFNVLHSGGLNLVAEGAQTPGSPDLTLGLAINGVPAVGSLLPFNDLENPVPLTTLNAGQVDTITLSGRYFGSFGDTPVRPEYNFVWTFETLMGDHHE